MKQNKEKKPKPEKEKKPKVKATWFAFITVGHENGISPWMLQAESVKALQALVDARDNLIEVVAVVRGKLIPRDLNPEPDPNEDAA
jgi:hypothetical protein